jgi:hypothetical protein
MMKGLHILIAIGFLVSCTSGSSPETKSETSPPAEHLHVATDSLADSLPAGVRLEDFGDGLDIQHAVAPGAGADLLLEGTYRNGRREGVWTEFHSNGRASAITGYVNGRKEGLHMEFSDTGVTLLASTYHNNMRHGVYKTWFNSVLKEVKTYRNDKVEGIAKSYYDDGTLQEEGLYVNGQREGVSRPPAGEAGWYDSKGKLSIEYEYRNGELVKQ